MGLGEDLLVRADAYATHVVCPEHGELVHAAPAAATGDRSYQTAPADQHGGACALGTLGHAPPMLQPQVPAAAVDVPTSRPLPPAPLIDQDIAVALVLGYAPKTSPPIA